MKAAQINNYGDPSEIEIHDTDKPAVDAEHLLVEVHAASLNPWDTFVRSGNAKDFLPLKLPVTLGGDIAGIVAEVGENVTGFAAGDRVFGGAGVPGGSGALAEFAAVKPGQIAKLPESLTFEEGAASVLTGISALQALKDHLNLQSGQRILIHGGAGGIGSLAVQLAKHLGAYVAATAGTEDVGFVHSLGADEVVDFKTQNFEDVLHDFDAVFDTVGGTTFEKSFRVMKRGGGIVSMIAQDEKNLAGQYGVRAVLQNTSATTEKLDGLAMLLTEHVLSVRIGKVFTLDNTRDAFIARESGSTAGKVVISIKQD